MLKKYLKLILPSKKRELIIISIVLLLAAGFLYYALWLAKPDLKNKKSISVAVVTDIHVGPEKKGHSESAVVHPKEYKNNLKPLIDWSPDLIITLGDNVNNNDKCHPYADDLIKLMDRFNVLWGKGNHDKDCFPTFSSQNYYYRDYDKAGWRIVMLDHDIDIDPEELGWLRETLKTDKKVLVVTHVPFFSPSRDENTLLPQYAEVEKVISEAGNVKYVFMGHLHSRLWDKEYNGVHYYILPSVSGEEYPQYFMKIVLD